jgi:hypothetical protein
LDGYCIPFWNSNKPSNPISLFGCTQAWNRNFHNYSQGGREEEQPCAQFATEGRTSEVEQPQRGMSSPQRGEIESAMEGRKRSIRRCRPRRGTGSLWRETGRELEGWCDLYLPLFGTAFVSISDKVVGGRWRSSVAPCSLPRPSPLSLVRWRRELERRPVEGVGVAVGRRISRHVAEGAGGPA